MPEDTLANAMANIYRAGIQAGKNDEVDCSTCDNRGKVYGLSQEGNCDHCIHQKHPWRKDLYKPIGEK